MNRHKFSVWLPYLPIALFAVVFSWLAITRHHAFASEFDLGVYDQVVWNTLHGRIFFYTSTGQPLLHLSNHADFILLLVAPFYLLYSGPETLLILQATLIGLAGLPVYWLARQKLNSTPAAFCLLAAYLLFPGAEVVTQSDFHPPALAMAFLIFAFYFLETRKIAPFFLFAVLAMACKEQIPLQVIFLGLYALIRHKDWRLGASTIALGAIWFAVVMYRVIPAFSVTQGHIFLNYYADLGGSPLEIVTTALTRPDRVWQVVWQPQKLAYLRDLLFPFAFLPLIGLPVLLVGAPSFAVNLLSNNPAMADATRGHYVADVTPWLVWASVAGLVVLAWAVRAVVFRFTRHAGQAERQSTAAVTIFSLILLGVALGWHSQHGLLPLSPTAPRWEVTAHHRLGAEIAAQIPPDAPVSAQVNLYAHTTNRKIAYVFPLLKEADYIFLDVTSITTPLHPNDYRTEVLRLLNAGQFGVFRAEDGYLLLKRGLANAVLPDEFYTFARAANAGPQHPLDVTFDNTIKLLGYDLLDDPRRAETAIRFYWQAIKPVDRDLRLYPFFTNAQNRLVEDTTQRPMVTQLWYPPRQWQTGEIVVSQTLPWALGDEWSLAAGVLSGDTWADWSARLPVAVTEASPGARRFEANTWTRLATFRRGAQSALEPVLPADGDLQPPYVAQFDFDNKMKLIGYGVNQSGAELAVTLYWQSLAAMGQDYTVFVHLENADGAVIAQHDGEPWWDIPLPTSTWLPAEKLRDRHTLALPADLPPGAYTLRMGVYYWQTLERLPVAGHGNSVALGPVQITD